MKKKRKAFTLIELLITLSLFSLAMMAIIGILSVSVRMLNRFSKQYNSQVPVILMTRVLETTLGNAWSVEYVTNSVIRIETFDNHQHIVEFLPDTCLWTEMSGIQILRRRKFMLPPDTRTELKVVQAKGRKGLIIKLDADKIHMDRVMLLGYRKTETEL